MFLPWRHSCSLYPRQPALARNVCKQGAVAALGSFMHTASATSSRLPGFPQLAARVVFMALHGRVVFHHPPQSLRESNACLKVNIVEHLELLPLGNGSWLRRPCSSLLAAWVTGKADPQPPDAMQCNVRSASPLSQLDLVGPWKLVCCKAETGSQFILAAVL